MDGAELTEWQLMKVLAENQGKQELLSRLVLQSDFTDKPSAMEMALNVFELTVDNVSRYSEAATKIAAFDYACGLRTGYRKSLLDGMLSKLNESEG